MAALLVVGAAPALASSAGPNLDEHQLLYEINMARWNPVEFERSTYASFPDVLAAPPLAISSDLMSAAGFKANEMSDHGYFSHKSAVTGMWPNELARSFGFNPPSYWPDDDNFLEAIQAGSDLPIDVLVSFANSEPHRKLVFGMSGFVTYNEIGVGKSSKQNYWAVYIARQDAEVVFVTGFVFDDLNGNGLLDPGEGLGGVEVSAGSNSRTTTSGGAYAIPVSPGKHTVSATVDGSAQRVTVKVRNFNVGVDFIAGARKPIARQYTKCNGLQPTILGTSGNDVLYGTDGPDVIHGLGGKDRIYGLGGDDVLCGGGGKDKLIGGDGDDTLLGGAKDDTLLGQGGDDTLDGGSGEDITKGGGGKDYLADAGEFDTVL